MSNPWKEELEEHWETHEIEKKKKRAKITERGRKCINYIDAKIVSILPGAKTQLREEM